MISQTVRFLLVAILLNALWRNSGHNKPDTFWLWEWFKCLHCLACHVLLLWQGMDWTVEVETHKHTLQFKKSHKEILTAEWRTMPPIPYCTCISFFFHWLHMNSDKQALPRNLNNIWENRLTCTISSKFHSIRSPFTAQAIWKE